MDEVLDLTIAKLSKLIEAIKERNDAKFVRDTIITEWSTKMVASVVAGTAQDESGKFKKSVDKLRFPWKEFGFGQIETLEQPEENDPNDLSYLETGDMLAADKNAGKQLPSF